MTLRKARTPVLILAALALILAACDGTAVVGAETRTDEPVDSAVEEFTFGSPAEASDADRTIEVETTDDFTFGPEEIMVSAGETITFLVTNTGNIPHDFTLGDQETQDEHEAAMAEMMSSGEMGHDEVNAVALEPGEQKELTWYFSEAGTFLVGCHQPGHYAAGMVGTVNVEA